MKVKVPLCYRSYITIGSPKWFIQCHKTCRTVRKQRKDLSPLQMKSWGTIWSQTQRRSLGALYSVQVLEGQHQFHHHVTILPNTFVFYYLLASVCPSPSWSGQRPVKAACYSFVYSDWMVLSIYMFPIYILVVEWWVGLAKKTHTINFSDHSVLDSWHIR